MGFIVADASAPLRGDVGRVSGFGVNRYHSDYGAAFDFATVSVDNTLLELERALGDAHYGTQYFEIIFEVRRGKEVAVDVCYNDGEIVVVETVAEKLPEIIGLAEVHKLDVDRIVEVTEHVDVVEAYLNRLVVMEFAWLYYRFCHDEVS